MRCDHIFLPRATGRGWSAAILIVWIFNIEGTLDLLNAVTQGLRYTQDGQLAATYFIPAVIVPALLVSHVMLFILLEHFSRCYRSSPTAP